MKLRIFSLSGLVTVAVLATVFYWLGLNAVYITLVLIAVEIAFSFDNAIINAKVLRLMSPFWQRLFLTIGMLISVFGMRVLFPLIIVSVSSRNSLATVYNLALHHPTLYSAELSKAHAAIDAYGGSFLLMLALQFFINDNHEILWIKRVEMRLKDLGNIWLPAIICLITLLMASILAYLFKPSDHNVLLAGLLGVGTYICVNGLSVFLNKRQKQNDKKAPLVSGLAGLWLFIYLEVLDTSFSFDGVLGAFAITGKIILIGAGLGVGALWVRSITLYMVRNGTLDKYIYLEHGAHYTIAVVATVLLLGLFVTVPSILVGIIGIGIIYSSYIASKQVMLKSKS
jgi:hypothetical protein